MLSFYKKTLKTEHSPAQFLRSVEVGDDAGRWNAFLLNKGWLLSPTMLAKCARCRQLSALGPSPVCFLSQPLFQGKQFPFRPTFLSKMTLNLGETAIPGGPRDLCKPGNCCGSLARPSQGDSQASLGGGVVKEEGRGFYCLLWLVWKLKIVVWNCDWCPLHICKGHWACRLEESQPTSPTSSSCPQESIYPPAPCFMVDSRRKPWPGRSGHASPGSGGGQGPLLLMWYLGPPRHRPTGLLRNRSWLGDVEAGKANIG